LAESFVLDFLWKTAARLEQPPLPERSKKTSNHFKVVPADFQCRRNVKKSFIVQKGEVRE